MYNSRMTVGSRARQTGTFKSSLGNNTTRYNSQFAIQRNKYFISSSKNSQDAPEWMSRTQSFHQRDHNRRGSLFSNPTAPFTNVQQTYVYARLPKQNNPEGQFNQLTRPKWRNKWEMKNHTFELEWPKPESQIKREGDVKSRSQLSQHEISRPSSKQNQIMRFQMPKYGYFESPLHRQKETPIKIGHPYVLNSTAVK